MYRNVKDVNIMNLQTRGMARIFCRWYITLWGVGPKIESRWIWATIFYKGAICSKGRQSKKINFLKVINSFLRANPVQFIIKTFHNHDCYCSLSHANMVKCYFIKMGNTLKHRKMAK